MATVLEHSTRPDLDSIPPPNILVVDDEAISRRAVIYALEKRTSSASAWKPWGRLEYAFGNRLISSFWMLTCPA